MPVDTIKTRMQSLNARELYSSTLDCAVSILRHEGVLAFWSGALPRLGRLILSGGIVFSVYVQLYPHPGDIASDILEVLHDAGMKR